MTKKPIATLETVPVALKHSPFAGLVSRADRVGATESQRTVPVKRVAKVVPSKSLQLRLRLESAGRSGKVVTRVSGLPSANVEVIASRLRTALGCGATVDGDDVLLLGSLAERATQWLNRVGDLRTIAPEKRTPGPTQPPGTAVDESAAGVAGSRSGTKRSNVRRGQRVAIVMKADQDSGKLTEGIVRDLLTNSEAHPRGIKVRLESGEVGRVKVLLE